MYNDIYGDYIKNRMTNKDREEKKDDTPIKFEKTEVENTDNNKKDSKSYEYDLIVKNGRVVIPGERVVKTNIFIKNGKIVLLGNDETISAKEVINAEGKYVIPGIVDPHVHYGIYNSLELDLETETSSALLGGVTTSGFFIGSDGNSHLKRYPEIEYVVNEKSSIDIVPHLVIDCETQLNELKDYVEYLGITSFKVYMNGIPGMIPDVDDGFILDVFKELKKLRSINDKITLCIHTENNAIVQRNIERIKKEKGDAADIVDWTDTHPPLAEEEAVIRIAFFAEKFEMPIYIVHVSSKDAIKRLEQIKKNNKFVNVETTSPYLSINKYSIDNSLIKMEPPFRGSEDQKELWEALSSGVIDSVGTDNVTLTTKEKQFGASIWDVKPGYPALETHLPVMISEGVVKRNIPIEKVIEKMTKNPAKIFGIYPQKGSLLPGSDADLVVLDLNKRKIVNIDNLSSRSDFSIYEGKELTGWPIYTIKEGKIVVENGKLTEIGIKGRCLKR